MSNRFAELEERQQPELKKFGKNHNRHKGRAAKRAEEYRIIEQRNSQRQQMYSQNHFSSHWNQSRHNFHEIEHHEYREHREHYGNDENQGNQRNQENRFVWHADSVSSQNIHLTPDMFPSLH
jgi:hypothetical protein